MSKAIEYLRKAEWADCGHCPDCEGFKTNGHKPDCPKALALLDLGEEVFVDGKTVTGIRSGTTYVPELTCFNFTNGKVTPDIAETYSNEEHFRCWKKQDKPTYSVGDRFEWEGTKYHLVLLALSKMILVNLSTGHRWNTPILVEDCNKITQDEMDKIFGNGKFTRYFDIQKGKKSNLTEKEAKKKIEPINIREFARMTNTEGHAELLEKTTELIAHINGEK